MFLKLLRRFGTAALMLATLLSLAFGTTANALTQIATSDYALSAVSVPTDASPTTPTVADQAVMPAVPTVTQVGQPAPASCTKFIPKGQRGGCVIEGIEPGIKPDHKLVGSEATFFAVDERGMIHIKALARTGDYPNRHVTPLGTFTIKMKDASYKMKTEEGYMPYSLFIETVRMIALHGSTDFTKNHYSGAGGYFRSFGCVNLEMPVAELVYPYLRGWEPKVKGSSKLHPATIVIVPHW